jgi:hypothetical protein
MLIRARDARGREGRLHARRAYIVGRHVWADNEDQEATRRVGYWQRVAQPMHFNGRGYELSDQSRGPAEFTWRLRAPLPGAYRVQACWTSDVSRASNAEYRASVSGVEQLRVTVDQSERGGNWVDLGQISLGESSACEVSLNGEADGTVSADAVRLALASS